MTRQGQIFAKVGTCHVITVCK